MQGPRFTLTVNEETNTRSDGTISTQTTTVISAPGKTDITLKSRISGTWELSGSIFRARILSAEFLSASDPSITKEAGQKAQDDQLAKKSVYETRILELTSSSYRSIPVNSMYKEAVVESSCKRT
jgi:hypothetical protein